MTFGDWDDDDRYTGANWGLILAFLGCLLFWTLALLAVFL